MAWTGLIIERCWAGRLGETEERAGRSEVAYHRAFRVRGFVITGAAQAQSDCPTQYDADNAGLHSSPWATLGLVSWLERLDKCHDLAQQNAKTHVLPLLPDHAPIGSSTFEAICRRSISLPSSPRRRICAARVSTCPTAIGLARTPIC